MSPVRFPGGTVIAQAGIRLDMNDQQDTHQNREQPALRWLAVGALAGLLVAAYGMLERSGDPSPLPAGSVARVNDALIDRARFDRAIGQLEISLGRDPDDAERDRVVQQLIDEELLVQRGIDLNMAVTEPSVRDAIVQSLVASVTAEADAANPDDDELERYLGEHAENYTYATALSVDTWISDDERQAQQFVGRLRNTDGEAPDTDAGVRRVPGLPRGPLPLERLRMFVGPAIAAAALNMPAGSSAVYARQGRWYILRVNRHEQSVRADLDAVRSQVLVDYRRAQARRLLENYLDGLRRQADLAVSTSR
jgi:hypothetical protein